MTRNGASVVMDNESLLMASLELTVPFWIEKWRGSDFESRAIRARECSEYIAAHGDNILYRSKTKGETAKAFNHLAEGLAIAAFQPGGVKFGRLHFVVFISIVCKMNKHKACPRNKRKICACICHELGKQHNR